MSASDTTDIAANSPTVDATPTVSSLLIAELEEQRSLLEPEQGTFFNREMTERELIEYLSFQPYYELRAAQFIGGWLASTPEPEAFVLLAQQVEDEAMHYEYCMRALARRGVTSLDNWTPEPEWEEWIDVWYPTGTDTMERVAAHGSAATSQSWARLMVAVPLVPPSTTIGTPASSGSTQKLPRPGMTCTCRSIRPG